MHARLAKSFRLCLLLPIVFLASCGGKNIGQALDDVEGKIAETSCLLARTGSLAEQQLLDTLLMKVQELRAQWKDTLGDSVETLDFEQQKTLATLGQLRQESMRS